MKKEVRTICYDNDLDIESYCLDGIVQPFPNHFHEFYVIGYMISGQRYLSCKGKEYTLGKGDIILFNPEDNHGCAQCGEEPLHYCAMNIPKHVMQKWVTEITGSSKLPYFKQNVVNDDAAANFFQPLHEALMTSSKEFEKEELLHFLLSTLLQNYSAPFEEETITCHNEVEKVCDMMEQHYVEALTLEELCACADMSKSTLLRAFTKSKGMTPYRYLQTVRVNEAKKLLENGISLIETAQQTGFYDQSHFTRFFTQFIGLSPSTYRNIFLTKEEK